jgi:levanase/fructan beta-fructosidase
MNPIKSISKENLIVVLILLAMMGCNNSTDKKNSLKSEPQFSEEELYRPNFHFTPEKSWMNDPNGMFYLNGKYHLYFQYYPDDTVWGPMHWGHAISEDLISWKEQPIALFPDSLGYIFSGSAVVDHKNTSGFGKDGVTAVVAIFTYHDMVKEKKGDIDFQSQAIAYSLDEGQTWTKYAGNPVLPNSGIKDFRDPKVVWDKERNRWIMALATYEKTLFYSSVNLKDWQYLSSFGEGLGAHGGVWECPDFFKMKVDNSEEEKWVLIQSLNPGHPNGGSGTQYFIGDFDGKDFLLDSSFAQDLNKSEAIWLDYGRDNYAGVTWSNIPESDGRKLFIGWMSNWDYATVVPTEKWRSTMTLARELKLQKINNSYRLESIPVKELDSFKEVIVDNSNLKFQGELMLYSNSEMILNNSVIEVELGNIGKDTYNFRLTNDNGDTIDFGLNTMDSFYYLDRRKSGATGFSEKFADKISKAAINSSSEELKVEIILDKTSIEVFYNDGETVMTEIFFLTTPFQTLELSSAGSSEVEIKKFKISKIANKE